MSHSKASIIILPALLLASACEQQTATEPAPKKSAYAEMVKQARGSAEDAGQQIQQSARRGDAIRDMIGEGRK